MTDAILSRFHGALVDALRDRNPDQLSRRHWGMDRFRIQALEKTLADPELAPGDRRAALETLVEKAGILAQGATKRGHREREVRYREKQRRYRLMLAQSEEAPA